MKYGPVDSVPSYFRSWKYRQLRGHASRITDVVIDFTQWP